MANDSRIRRKRPRKLLTRQRGDVSGLLEPWSVVVEIRDTNYQVRGRLVNTVAGDNLQAVFRPCFGIQTSSENDFASVSIDTERTWAGHVTKSIGQSRGAVHVVRRDGG